MWKRNINTNRNQSLNMKKVSIYAKTKANDENQGSIWKQLLGKEKNY